MYQDGGIGALMALSQLTPEQFQLGVDRFKQLRSGFGAQQPTQAQPAVTQVNETAGGFGTGATPYTQPYYQSSFARNPYFGGYGMGYQPSPYMPMMGRVGFNPMGRMGYGAFGGGGYYSPSVSSPSGGKGGGSAAPMGSGGGKGGAA